MGTFLSSQKKKQVTVKMIDPQRNSSSTSPSLRSARRCHRRPIDDLNHERVLLKPFGSSGPRCFPLAFYEDGLFSC